VAGSEECQAQGGEALFLGQGGVAGAERGVVDLRRGGAGGGSGKDHGADLLWVVRRDGTGDEVPVGVAEDDRRAVAELADDVGDIGAELVDGGAGHRACGAGDASRLGPQDAVADFGERRAECAEVLAAVASVGGQDYDVGPVALSVGVGLDGYRAGGDDFRCAGSRVSPSADGSAIGQGLVRG
jgi:hypothetical protein